MPLDRRLQLARTAAFAEAGGEAFGEAGHQDAALGGGEVVGTRW